MKKILSASLISLFFVGLFSVTELREVKSDTIVPQGDSPRACEASRQNRMRCFNWYYMTENPTPEACESARQNREDCARWYHVTKETKPIVIRGINFEFNQFTIMPSSFAILNTNLEALKMRGNPRILIIGHTDSIGSTEYNQKLSEKRAFAVKKYFISQGYNPNKIKTEGRGELEPVASNTFANGTDNPEGRFENRRIEIHFE